jgi:hypothetical protein
MPFVSRAMHPPTADCYDLASFREHLPLPRHGSLQQHRRRHPIVAQRGHHGHGLPRTEGHLAHQPFAPRTSPAASPHAGRNRRLIDEHQPLGIECALPAAPAPPHGGYVRPVLLGRVQDFFESQLEVAENRNTDEAATFTRGLSRNWWDVACIDMTGREMLTWGSSMRWVLRLIKTGMPSGAAGADVIEISRPDSVADIADLGLTLSEAKQLLARVHQPIVAGKQEISRLGGQTVRLAAVGVTSTVGDAICSRRHSAK